MGERHHPDIPRVYFDLDGVLADLMAAATSRGCHPSEFKLLPGAYRNIPLIPGSREAVSRIEAMGYLTFVLTKIPRMNPTATSEKLHWVLVSHPNAAATGSIPVTAA